MYTLFIFFIHLFEYFEAIRIEARGASRAEGGVHFAEGLFDDPIMNRTFVIFREIDAPSVFGIHDSELTGRLLTAVA